MSKRSITERYEIPQVMGGSWWSKDNTVVRRTFIINIVHDNDPDIIKYAQELACYFEMWYAFTINIYDKQVEVPEDQVHIVVTKDHFKLLNDKYVCTPRNLDHLVNRILERFYIHIENQLSSFLIEQRKLNGPIRKG